MSEHKTNPTALLASTYPPALPPGYQSMAALHIQVVEKENVRIVPPTCMRTVEGKVEILRLTSEQGEPTWVPAPDGAIIHEAGKPLPPELCDVVIALVTLVQDVAAKAIVGLAGEVTRPRQSAVVHGQLMRMPLVEWRGRHLGALGVDTP
jgi:hypothetical protein